MSATLAFRVGARTLATIPRRLHRVALSLDQVLAGELPALPALSDRDGWLVTSLPAANVVRMRERCHGNLVHLRQHYVRYYADLTLGADQYEAAWSASLRSGLRRKARRLAAANDGVLDIRRYRTPDEIAAFLPLARSVSATTYQERLLDAGLPDDAAFRDEALRRAAADAIRGWLLFLHGAPIAYLCCPAEGETLLYLYVGHDPEHHALSPGSVLMAQAMRDLQSDRFRRFDFTEGEGQHKRQFATGGVACVDLLILPLTLANRLALAALGGFDRVVGLTKRIAGEGRVKRLVGRLGR